MKQLIKSTVIVLLFLCVPMFASERYDLKNEGKIIARYEDSPFKSYIGELRTPSGKNVLRVSPADHVHHRGLMYAMWVGGYNFWEESEPKSGKQVSQKITQTDGTIESNIHWMIENNSGTETLLHEMRKISLAKQSHDVTLLDWESTFKAPKDTELGKVGAGHYHGLGMRFAETMDKDCRFFNSTGKHNGEIFRGDERLTPCRWIACIATLDGKPVTVALFDHPSNPVPMTAFTMGDAHRSFAYMSATMNLYCKSVPLKSGETFAVKYRVAVWDGEVTSETMENVYSDYIR